MPFIDFNEIIDIFQPQESHSTFYVTWIFVKNGGWILILWAVIIGFRDVWLNWRQGVWANKRKWILLAVDVPRNIEQSPKAAENIFSALMGSYSGKNLVEKWMQGQTNDRFSFEVVSHEGYTQFYICINRPHRDLVESAIYAQYPDAEIVEVEDYTKSFPNEFPDENYDLWGAELVPYANTFYPIRTYVSFEHQLSQSFKDPMAGLLEAMSRMGPGENIWFSVVVSPREQDWQKQARDLIKKSVGQRVEVKKGMAEKFVEGSADLFFEVVDSALGTTLASGPQEKPQQYPSLMQYLSPYEKNAVEGLSTKVSKLGFNTKIRFLYIARKEVFSKAKGVGSFMGSINQFGGDLNGLKPDSKTKTKVDYFLVRKRVAWRQTKLINAYKSRSNWEGANNFILNTEELASLWHFPIIDVKAPMVTKTGSRKAEPPGNIPIFREPLETVSENRSPLSETHTPDLPVNLPIVET